MKTTFTVWTDNSGFSKDTFAAALAEGVNSCLWWLGNDPARVKARLTVHEVCAACHSEGRIITRGGRGSKACPDCKGKHAPVETTFTVHRSGALEAQGIRYCEDAHDLRVGQSGDVCRKCSHLIR